jgi:serine/threonine-protein kinase
VGSTERLEEGLEIFAKVCDAVAYAHHRGVIHRDIKPGNVMVAGFGQVYLMDWGLARLSIRRPASGSAAAMEAPGPVGTPGYMAPEQARGNPHDMDERTDIFGLGAMLCEIVTGKTPLGDISDPDEIIERTKKGQLVPIDELAGSIGISKRLKNIVSKAIAPNPADRHASVVELQKDVLSFLRGGFHLPRKLFRAGERIIAEGDPGDSAYMIVSGKCRAVRAVGEGQETLGVMGPGDVFGEMALLLEEPRAATVEAVDTVTVLVLDKATMTEGLGIDGWTGALVRALAQRFRDLEHQVRSSGMRRSGSPSS